MRKEIKEELDNKNTNLLKILSIIIIIVFVSSLFVLKYFSTGNISNINKVLNNKYDSISCIDSRCEAVEAIEKNKNYSNIKIVDTKGRIIGKYSFKNNKNRKKVYSISKKYLLMKKKVKKDVTRYYITNKSGKNLYSSRNKLVKISNEYVLEQIPSKIDYKYKIINSNGELLYKNINDYNAYDDNIYMNITKDDKSYLINTINKKVFNNYIVKEEVKDENDKTLYLILTKSNSDLYYFFNTNYNEISLNGFSDYVIQYDKSLLITRKQNNTILKYKISSSGTESKLSQSKFLSILQEEINDKINKNKYNLYFESVVDENQENVLVDNKEDKSFGIYNLNTKKYNKLYSYSSDRMRSNFNKLSSMDENDYLQITCDDISCDTVRTLVYNVQKNKVVLNLEGSDKLASKFIYYKNGYKVIKYAKESLNDSFRDKYALIDKDNKVKKVSANEIKVIDSYNVIGESGNNSVLLYSKSKNKFINDNSSVANLIKIGDKSYYKYRKNNKTIIVDKKGNELYSNKKGDLYYSENSIYSVSNRNIKIYSIKNDKVSSYNFMNNESINDITGEQMNPYNGAIFINESNGKYMKVLNDESKIIRKIRDVSISSVRINEKEKRAFIIVKSNKKYGLYIAK